MNKVWLGVWQIMWRWGYKNVSPLIRKWQYPEDGEFKGTIYDFCLRVWCLEIRHFTKDEVTNEQA